MPVVLGVECVTLINVYITQSVNAVVDSYHSVLEKKTALAKALALPIVLYFFGTLSVELLDTPKSYLSLGFWLVVEVYIFVVVSVTTHRLILLPDEPSRSFGIPLWGMREWDFFIIGVKVFFYCLLVVVLGLILFTTIPNVAEHIVMVVVAYIVSRLSLVFPSTAINVRMDPSDSWTLTSNHQFLMFTVVFIYTSLFAIIEIGLSELITFRPIIATLNWLILIFTVAALSQAHKIVMKDSKPSNESGVQP